VTVDGTGKVSGDRHPKVRDGVLIGSSASMLGNVRIGAGAKIGVGAVVLCDMPEGATFVGNPAKAIGKKKALRRPEEQPGVTMEGLRGLETHPHPPRERPIGLAIVIALASCHSHSTWEDVFVES
jgi:hypothetical protein